MKQRALLAATFVISCAGQEPGASVSEPLRIDGAQYFSGTLPGSAPLEDATQAPKGEPTVNAVDLVGLTVAPGQPKNIAGRASANTVAIGIALPELSHGYFTVPVGAKDLGSSSGEFGWTAQLGFGINLPPGPIELALVAIDKHDHAGPKTAMELCALPPYPDNLNACSKTSKPPYLIVSLGWDSLADLDLRVVTPEGKIVGAKAPTTSNPQGSSDAQSGDITADANNGVLDKDARANCTKAGLARENVAWQEKPSPGVYRVYVTLFDTCADGESTAFRISTLIRSEQKDSTFSLREKPLADGEMLTTDANAGVGLGLFVSEFRIQ